MTATFSNYTILQKVVFITILGIILLLNPIIGLFLSILLFRNNISILLFVYCAFCFGWFYEPQMYLLNHYNNFLKVKGVSLFELWTSDITSDSGKEPYPVLFKYSLSKISDSPNLFSALACTFYALSFVFFITSFKQYYNNKLNLLQCILMICLCVIVGYYWFLGFRFWTGTFVFAGAYIRYILTSKQKYLYLSALCLMFHFSLIVLVILAMLNNIIKGNKWKYILVVIGWLARLTNNILIMVIPKLPIIKDYMKKSMVDENITKSVSNLISEYRQTGNVFYMYRNDVIFIFGLIIIYLLWRHDKRVLLYNNKFWGFIILLYAITMFGYSQLTFYDRFYQLDNILIYSYIFIYVSHITHSINNNLVQYKFDFRFSVIALIPMLYAILTIIISQRDYLLQLKIWSCSPLLF